MEFRIDDLPSDRTVDRHAIPPELPVDGLRTAGNPASWMVYNAAIESGESGQQSWGNEAIQEEEAPAPSSASGDLGDKPPEPPGDQLVAGDAGDEPHHNQDRPYEPIPIPEQEIPAKAAGLLASLQDVVSGWEPASESPIEGGQILRTYNKEEERGGEFPGAISFTAQLVYDDAEATAPASGNLEIYDSTSGWPWESHFRADTVSRYEGDQPKIYHNSHPFHREDYGRPERNTESVLEQAQRMVARLQQLNNPETEG